MTLKTIIFDFDGTVADTMQIFINIFNKVSRNYALPTINSQDVEKLKNLSALEVIKLYKLSPVKLLKLTIYLQSELRKHIEEISIFLGISDLFDKLKSKNIQIGIVTSNTKENVEKFLQKNNIVVDFVDGERDIFGKGKKLIKLIKRLKLNKDETIYVGDEVRDVDAAREAGIKIASVTWGMNSEERLKKANPDWIISSPTQLMASV